MTAAIRFSAVTVNCRNANDLATFYAEITGGRITVTTDAWASWRPAAGSISKPFPTTPRRPGPIRRGDGA
jgi:hypothetical protein